MIEHPEWRYEDHPGVYAAMSYCGRWKLDQQGDFIPDGRATFMMTFRETLSEAYEAARTLPHCDGSSPGCTGDHWTEVARIGHNEVLTDVTPEQDRRTPL